MAGAGTSSKPEMFSRGVQTGYTHPHQRPDRQDPLPVCICGQAAEGNCWCESLSFLNYEALKQVQEKGFKRSRVAILLSIHEEYCRVASGNQIINARRRGSAHGDMRLGHPRVPPPTLPRRRAQSMNVRNSRGSISNNEARFPNRENVLPCAPKPPQVVKPKIHNRVVEVKIDSAPKCEVKLKPARSQESIKEETCLGEIKVSESNDERCKVEQDTQSTKAWIFFKEYEKGIKVENANRLQNSKSKEDQSCQKTSRKDSTSDSDHSDHRLQKHAKESKERVSVPKETNTHKSVVNITEIHVCSVAKVESQTTHNNVPTNVCDKDTGLVCSGGSEVVTVTAKDCENEPCERIEAVTAMKENDSKCNEESMVASVDVTISSVVSHSNDLDEVPLPNDSTSLKESLQKDLSCGSPTVHSAFDLSKGRDCSGLEVDVVTSSKRSERLSCRDSGIGDDVSVSELKRCSSHSVIPEDQVEPLSYHSRSEEDCHKGHISTDSFDDVSLKDAECNIAPASEIDSRMIDEPLEASKESSLSDSTQQRDDDSVLGACAILKDEDSLAISDQCLSIDQTEDIVFPLDTRLSEDTIIHDTQTTTTFKQSETPSEMDIKQADRASMYLTETPDARFKSEHKVFLQDGEHSENNVCKGVYLKDASVDLSRGYQKVNLDPHDEQPERDREVIDDAVRDSMSKKPENRQTREQRSLRHLDPCKFGVLRFQICQSPLVLCGLTDSDFDDSDSESEDGYSANDTFAQMPIEIVCMIFRELSTRDLNNLKCTCKNFKWLIETHDIKGVDSLWVETQSYRNDPCMQCGKIRDPSGDVSMCRWHPKIYYRNGHIGRSYWTCCRNADEDAQGCQVGLHDNNWTTSRMPMRSIPRRWSNPSWHAHGRIYR